MYIFAMAMLRLFFLASLLIAVSGVCRDGWIRFHGSCYLFRETPKENWQDAKNYCAAIKSHLVQIDDADENNFLKAEIALFHMGHHDCFWTDGTDMDAEGLWMWSTSQTSIEQTFWTPGEPNSINKTKPDEDCINLPVWQQLQWNDEYCTMSCSFVCELEDEFVDVVG